MGLCIAELECDFYLRQCMACIQCYSMGNIIIDTHNHIQQQSLVLPINWYVEGIANTYTLFTGKCMTVYFPYFSPRKLMNIYLLEISCADITTPVVQLEVVGIDNNMTGIEHND